MAIKKAIKETKGIYFITFTCHEWMSLISLADAYDLVYKWFNYLTLKGHNIAGYVIMPNHIHVLIYFNDTAKSINTIIGDGKRFMAYGIIKRLQEKKETGILSTLHQHLSASHYKKGQQYVVWKESFDWKRCDTPAFVWQKLNYIHKNPCRGKWQLAEHVAAYEHCSARYYLTGQHAAYKVRDVDEILYRIT